MICASLEPMEAMVLLSGDPVENLVVNSSSPVATKDEDEEYLGLKVRATVHESFNFKGVLHSCPTIRELVGDLDKS